MVVDDKYCRKLVSFAEKVKEEEKNVMGGGEGFGTVWNRQERYFGRYGRRVKTQRLQLKDAQSIFRACKAVYKHIW